MRTWRVGTLSMGVTLLFMGIGLLYAQINNNLVLDWVVKWWPLVFILLGIEVLWQSYQAKKTSTAVAYDILSVFIVGILVCFGVAMEALHETGVIEQCKTALVSQNFTLQEPLDPIPVDAGLNKIIFEQSSDPLEIISCPADKITASISADVTATSRIDAMNLLKQNQVIQTRREGDTLYIAFNSSNRVSHMSPGVMSQRNKIYLPEQMKVGIYSGVSDIKIHASSINNDWYINGVQSAALDFPSSSNLQLTAQTNSQNELQGNAEWTIKEKPPIGDTNQEYAEPTQIEGKLVLGTGQHKITIKSNGPVAVDLLP